MRERRFDLPMVERFCQMRRKQDPGTQQADRRGAGISSITKQ
jgi:hypothetical protein